MLDPLSVACDPTRSPVVRRAAWDNDCIAFWYRSHVERGLRLGDVAIEYRDRVYDLIKAHAVKALETK